MAQVSSPTESQVLVTGASGFVGTALCSTLSRAGYSVRRALRTVSAASASDTIVGEIDGDTTWTSALDGVDIVVHLAARTHVTHDRARNPLAEYRRINVCGTETLAQSAVAAGVRRFIFLSSVKVNGEATLDKPFRETDLPRPEDAYGITKLEAEERLAERAQAGGMELVILRPPLVYGPGVKGNFLRLMRLVARGIPLPLASIENRRSLVYLDNLTDAIVACIRSPDAAGRTYLVSDAESLSTPALVRQLAAALQVKTRLIHFPVALLEATAALAGKTREITRLTRSLEVDNNRIRRELAWVPPLRAAQGLADTARWYNAQLCARALE